MESSKKRKDVYEDKESSQLERDEDQQEIDPDHSESSPSKIKKCSSKPSLNTSVVADNSSAPSSQQPPGNHGAQERDQRHFDQYPQPETMQAPRYYTRSAARKLPPPPPSQLRAGKLLIQNVDRGRRRHAQVYKNTLMRETATSRVTPLVPPDAHSNASGIVPLGPPPPREPGLSLSPRFSAQQREMKLHDKGLLRSRLIAKFSESSDSGAESSQNSQPAEAGHFQHLPPPSMSHGDAWDIVVACNERIKNLQDDSDRREQFLALQTALGFPESAGLFELYQSGSMEEVTNYLMDYFESWEARKTNFPEVSQAEGQVSSEKDLGQQKKAE